MAVALSTCGGRIERAPDTDATAVHLVELADFVPSLQKVICNAAEKCCDEAGMQRHRECHNNVVLVWQPILDHAMAIQAAYDATQASRCVAQIEREWAQCASHKIQTSVSDEICALVFEAPAPRQQLGGSCYGSMDCQQDDGFPVLCVLLNASPPGTCMRHLAGGEGAPCGGIEGSIQAECVAPFICGTDRVCHPRPDVSQPCGDRKSDDCGVGLVCDKGGSHVCRPATPVDNPCQNATECEDLRCLRNTCRVLPDPDLLLALYCQDSEASPDQSAP